MKIFEEGIDMLKDVGSWDLCENTSVFGDGLLIIEVSKGVNTVKTFAARVTPTEDTPLDRENQLKRNTVQSPNLTAERTDVHRIKEFMKKKIYRCYLSNIYLSVCVLTHSLVSSSL